MSFAQRFAAGQQIAQNLIDTYDAAKKSREIEEIATAKPEERSDFSEEDGAQLEAASKVVNPETGQPYYDIQAKDGGYQVGLSAAEMRNAPEQPGPGMLMPTTKTDFLGKTHEGKLDADQVKGLRSRASADLLGKYDPVSGLRYHALLDQQDRTKIVQGREDTTWAEGQEEIGNKKALQAAQAKLSQSETPEEEAAAKADLLKIPGGLDIYKQHGVTKNAIYNAHRETLFRAVQPLAERGDIGGVIKAYSMYHDGNDARLAADGSIEIVSEKTGDVLQTIKFKDGKDLSNIIWRSIFPEKALELDQKAAAEEKARRAKVDDAFAIRAAQLQANGVYGQPRTGASSGSTRSTAADAVPSVSLADQAVSAWRGVMKNAPSTATQGIGLSDIPTDELTVRRVAEISESRGKQVRPEMIAKAVADVREGKVKPLPDVNPATGEIDLSINYGRDGSVTYDSNLDPSRDLQTKDDKQAVARALLTLKSQGRVGLGGNPVIYVVNGDKVVPQNMPSSEAENLKRLIGYAAHYDKDGAYQSALDAFVEKQVTLEAAGRVAQLRASGASQTQVTQEVDKAKQRLESEKLRMRRIVDLTRQFEEKGFDPANAGKKSSFRNLEKTPIEYGDAPGNFEQIGLQ